MLVQVIHHSHKPDVLPQRLRKKPGAAAPRRERKKKRRRHFTIVLPAKPTHPEVRHGEVALYGPCSSLAPR